MNSSTYERGEKPKQVDLNGQTVLEGRNWQGLEGPKEVLFPLATQRSIDDAADVQKLCALARKNSRRLFEPEFYSEG